MSEATDSKETQRKYNIDTDSIYSVEGFSVRTLNCLARAGVTTIPALLKLTDCELFKIKNFGQKRLDEINAAFPERQATYEGEAEFLEAQRKLHKLDETARRILRFMEKDNMKLADFMASDIKVEGRAKARAVLTEYCLIFPDRIDGVLEQLEAMGDTSDKFYLTLKLSADRKNAIAQGLAES